jgi:hypothetical protein
MKSQRFEERLFIWCEKNSAMLGKIIVIARAAKCQ